jgi:hypothetical protein
MSNNGYIRQDNDDNISNGNVINANDLDNEFNAIKTAFSSVDGHTHDPTVTGGGAAIEKIGPQQNLVVSATSVLPKTTNTLDVGSSGAQFKDAYFDGILKAHTVYAGDNAGLILTDNNLVSSNTLTINGIVSSGILLQQNTANIGGIVKKSSTNDIVIKSGTTTAATFTAADVDFSGKVDITDETTLDDKLTVTGETALNGGLVMDTDKFTVADTTGNTAIAGTLDVTGTTTLSRLELDDFVLDSTTLSLTSGNLTLDAAGDINLDADGGDVILKDGGTVFGSFNSNIGSNRQLVIKSGSSQTTAATFNDANVTFANNATVNGNTTLGNDAAADQVVLNSKVASNIIPDSSSRTIGDGSTSWNHGYFGAVTTSGNVIVGGDLTVSGTMTTIDTANLSVEDSLIELARANTSTDSLDVGIFGTYYGNSAIRRAGLFRDASDSSKWKLFNNTLQDLTSSTTVDTGATGYTVSTLVANLEGNADTAATLETARTIAGVSFDGGADIDIGLNGLSDINIASVPSNGEILKYDTTTSKWIVGSSASSLSSLTDVNSSMSPSDGQLLRYDNANTEWTAVTAGISDISGLQTALNDKETADAEILKADTDDNITAGYTATADDDGTKSSGTYTPSPAGGNLKRIINGGAFTLAAPTATGDYTMVIQMTNNSSAGTVTLSGFTKLVNQGYLTTTNGDDFFIYVTKINGFTSLTVQALQ